MKTPGKGYICADILRSENGYWGASYYGKHYDQGGPVFKKATIWMEDLDALMNFVAKEIGQYAGELDQMISERKQETHVAERDGG